MERTKKAEDDKKKAKYSHKKQSSPKKLMKNCSWVKMRSRHNSNGPSAHRAYLLTAKKRISSK